MPPSYKVSWFLLLSVALLTGPALAHEHDPHPDKVITAVRADGPLKIDGRLDDSSWIHAVPVGGFAQREPVEGSTPTESTFVQVVYDDEAIYFGFTMLDKEPARIAKRLARRDRPWDGDRISVNIDPYHDHRTGYFFVVNAAGVQGDGLLFNDNNEDTSWDGVWESGVQVTPKGWAVEMKIPYHVLRFTRQEVYTWGVNFIRDMYRQKERDYWALVKRSENGWVSRFGHIVGIEHISPPLHLQAIPYGLSKGQIAPISPQTPTGNTLGQNAGVDLKYGVTSNITLDATVNPDFGQVEADEAVLNLSTFETFFQEKRPFFVEGSQIFDTPLGLFYSRRIGRPPSRSADLRGGSLLNRPTATTILGAAKLTGRTANGTTLGLITGVTAAERATVADSAGIHHTDIVEPRAVYNVLRLKRDVMKNSSIGLMATSSARNGEFPATTGGADWNLNFANSMYNINGQLVLSRTGQERRETGLGGSIRLAKNGGEHIYTSMNYQVLSPNFNTNDLGFLRRPNIHNTRFGFNIHGNHDWWLTRRRNINLNGSSSWNFSGAKLQQGGNINLNTQLKNFWWIGGGIGGNLAVEDDRETRGNGLIRIPTEQFMFLWIDSDDRQRVAFSPEINLGSERDGRFENYNLFTRFQVSNNIELRFGPQYSRSRGVSRWVSNVTDPANPDHQIPVFGELDTDRFSLITRGNLTFTRNVSFQLYNQVFFAAGKHRNFKALVSPDTFGPLASGLYTESPDFNSRSFTMNAIFRWEYRPGSTLFLVWTQARNGAGAPGDARFTRNLLGIFDAAAENVVLMKLNYWWNL